MSVSKYHYVKFLDEVEEITDSKSKEGYKKKFDFSEEDTNMSSTNYTDQDKAYLNNFSINEILKELREYKEENDKLKKENQVLKEELVITKNASDSYLNLLGGDDGTIDKMVKLKKENDELKKKTYSEDIRGNNIRIKMNQGYLWEYVYPVLEDRDHMKNYFDELDDLPDNLGYEIDFKEDMEEFFYENLTYKIQRRLNGLKIFGGIHSAHNLSDMVHEDIHDFINEALTQGDCFEIEVEEEEEESSDEDEEDN